MRNYLGRKLQHFINMLLIPHPKVGIGKTEVMLIFNSPFMKDRTFTVSVTRNERATFTQTSAEALRSLNIAATTMSNTASAIMDFTEALQQVEFEEKEALFLEPLLTDVFNAVKATTKDARMRRTHRLVCLQGVLKRVAARLNEPNLLPNLMNEYSKTKFMATASLYEIVQWMKSKHYRKTKTQKE